MKVRILSISIGLVLLSGIAWTQMILDDFGFKVGGNSRFGILLTYQGEKVATANTPELHPLYKTEIFYQEKQDIWRTRIAANISPISVNSQLGLICVLEDLFGIQLSVPFTLTFGTGWHDKIFGNGIGIASNFYDSSIKDNVYSKETFTKMYFKAALGTTFQGFLIERTLSLTLAQNLYYRYFLGTKSDSDIWLYENQGDNLKYFRFMTSGMLTLHLPLFLKEISLYGEGDWDIQHYSVSPVNQGGWGSDLPIVKFGTIWGVGKQFFSIKLKLEWGNTPAYQEGYGENILLTERRINTEIVQYWYLKKIAILATLEI
ncbi:hypothetical protein [Thermospira aquatica]|uniref:Protochlamydia outer membrane protein domain-containing protein n=1 Tax=Thermospira aquatica TaxID=2828656 RepID=A0AAX3BBG4_9SPIR|nr:hypothetical protein [Thermospira aquatica]URA09529.1 hypothetical protein KDW03_08525 [Thermospira aquatica]